MATNYPNMGVTYGSLAQMTKPEPYGAGLRPGLSAGMLGQYWRDKDRHDAMLQQAATLAQRDAELKATAADEYGMGAPGRRADIRTNNALAQGKEGLLPDLLDIQRQEVGVKKKKFTEDEIKAEEAKLSAFADEYAQAPDEQGKAEVVERMKAAGVTRVGVRSVDEIVAAGRMDALMERVSKKSENTPEFRQKKALADERAAAALKKEQEKNASRERVARWTLEAKKALESGKYKKAENPEWKMFEELMARTTNQDEKDLMYSWWTDRQRALEVAKAGAKPQQLDMDPAMFEGSGLRPRTPPAPARATPPPRVGGGGGAPAPDDPKVGNTWNGKRITNVQRDKTTGKAVNLKLEDGSIVPFK